MPTFTVPAGVKCHVRGPADRDWRPHVTAHESRFDAYTPADNGGCWVFARGGWELKVPACFVAGRKPEPKRGRASKGRGASRRAAQRAVRARRNR